MRSIDRGTVNPIRVIVVESDLVFARELVDWIARDERLRVVGLAGDHQAVLAFADAALHDLILLGHVECDGLAGAVSELREITSSPIVALVGDRPFAGASDGIEALSAFIPRLLEPEALVASLYEVALLVGASRRSGAG